MKNALLYAPFMVLALLFPVNTGGHLLLYPALGVDEDTGILVSLILIAAGVVLGLVGLFTNTHMRWYFRLAVVALFVPAVGASLVISGM